MFKFTFKFTLTFTSAFLLEVIIYLGTFYTRVEIWYATYPDLDLQLCAKVAPESCPEVGLEDQNS